MTLIVIIDNYDSFTYNLVHALGELRLGHRIKVVLNDAVTVEQVRALDPTHLVISPGPCGPDRAGVSVDAVRALAGVIPILGVCLGHQGIAQAFGGRIMRADRLMHGKTSVIHHDGRGLFENVPNPFVAMRYHSLTVDEATLPDGFEITARTEAGEVMGIRHHTMPIEGVQFHPESFATDAGAALLRNFVNMTASRSGVLI